MERKLYTKSEVIDFIANGKKMVISGDEKLLDKLPEGNWIGGTSPYFMDKNGGVLSKTHLFVDDFTEIAQDFKIQKYTKDTIKSIATNSFVNGFIVLIIPGESDVLVEFGINSMNYENIFDNPLVGYIAGFDLQNMGTDSSKVYLGTNAEKLDSEGVAIHVKLPDNKVARTEILNLNTIDKNSPKITFPLTSFEQSDCEIDGKKANFAEFITEINYKQGLPIVANYNGALINRDIKKIDKEQGKVQFFSPVFNDEEYFLVNIIDNYHEKFIQQLKTKDMEIPYTCICVSYYGLGALENKKIDAQGVFAFGEIAYQLLNQTLVFLEIDESK